MHELSQEMQQAIQNVVQEYSRDELIRNGRIISEKYRGQIGAKRRLSTNAEAAAYAVSRMPATYGAAHFALTECAKMLDLLHVKSHLDCGCGTGAVVLAVNDLLSPDKVFMQEYEPGMATMGRKIMAACNLQPDFLSGNICEAALPDAELVTEGYVLGELACGQRKEALLNMWDAAQRLMLIIEPGTKEGFSIIREAKTLLTREGAYVVAPCVAKQCPVHDEDWCHFSVRISRTQLHKAIKNGDAPFEDEKFCYAAFSREPITGKDVSRIIRHPIIERGRIVLSLCAKSGKQELAVIKKDALWKQTRKAKWGETIEESHMR